LDENWIITEVTCPNLVRWAPAPPTNHPGRLVLPVRDQIEIHDEPGSGEPEAGEPVARQPAKQPGKSPRPPALAEELTVRAGHFRLWYEKTGPAAWLSTLEIQSVLARSFRRAGIHLTFSQGFHPLPRMSFGRALPVGLESVAEWLDIFTREPYTPEDLLRRLAGQTPEGLTVVKAEVLGPGKKQPQPMVEEFTIGLCGTDERLAAWKRAWSGFGAATSFVRVFEGKKGPREVDLRPLVTGLHIAASGSLTLTCDWTPRYLSPFKLINAVAGEVPLEDLAVRKVSQRFS
jgi:radical SAM-linked protein